MKQIEKAAVLLMSLPEELASTLLGKLTPRQAEAVCMALAQVDALSAKVVENTILEFAETNPTSIGRSSDGLDYASSLLQRTLGKNAAETVENVRQTEQRTPFSYLETVAPEYLATFLAEEHPQTIALILSHLPPRFGAQMIGSLEQDEQVDVIRRIANMGQTSPEMIKEVEQALERRMRSVMTPAFENAGGLLNVVEILNVSDRATERALLENLSRQSPELVDEIRRLMFAFEDISKFSDRDIQSVLQNVETSQWTISLKGASQELKEKVLGNMSQRAAQSLSEDMELLGSVQVSEVEARRREIVDIVRRLQAIGEISGVEGDADEAFIE